MVVDAVSTLESATLDLKGIGIKKVGAGAYPACPLTQ